LDVGRFHSIGTNASTTRGPLSAGKHRSNVFSAKGAVSLLAWGNAPGFMKLKNASAESAIHFMGEFNT
jgi:hypothetical protein